MTRRIVALVLALLVMASTLAVPRRAAATDNLEYIIASAVGGAVALVAIVAILMADRSEPEYDLVQRQLPQRRPSGGIRLAPACAPDAQGLPLVCW